MLWRISMDLRFEGHLIIVDNDSHFVLWYIILVAVHFIPYEPIIVPIMIHWISLAITAPHTHVVYTPHHTFLCQHNSDSDSRIRMTCQNYLGKFEDTIFPAIRLQLNDSGRKMQRSHMERTEKDKSEEKTKKTREMERRGRCGEKTPEII